MKTYILIEKGELYKTDVEFDVPLNADLEIKNMKTGELLGLGVVCIDYGSNTVPKNKTKAIANKIGR
ncbi:MAG: hypothetical protein ACRCX8_00720 [Sarcina sp.]